MTTLLPFLFLLITLPYIPVCIHTNIFYILKLYVLKVKFYISNYIKHINIFLYKYILLPEYSFVQILGFIYFVLCCMLRAKNSSWNTQGIQQTCVF
jgi:hypothetical protein